MRSSWGRQVAGSTAGRCWRRRLAHVLPPAPRDRCRARDQPLARTVFVAMIFAFTSIAVTNTLAMIGLRRWRELALLRLVGATRRQVRSMAP
jgi:hypothetical protein